MVIQEAELCARKQLTSQFQSLENRKNKPLPLDDARTNEIIQVDLERLNAGAAEENIVAIPGDSVYVKKAPQIFVTGEVKNPGTFRWEKHLTVRKAIALADGSSTAGSSERTQIIRMIKDREIRIKPKMSDPVKPEDIIKVPRRFF